MEQLINLIEENGLWLNGFVMTGVILILIGVKNVTTKEMREYKLSHTNFHKIDEILAWGIFYIIFGILITAGTVVTIYLYRN